MRWIHFDGRLNNVICNKLEKRLARIFFASWSYDDSRNVRKDSATRDNSSQTFKFN